MQKPFELNLQKLSLEALHAERERSKLMEQDIAKELEQRSGAAVEAAVTDFLGKLAALGVSPKQALQLVKDRVTGNARSEPGEKPASARPVVGPTLGTTYVHPSDPQLTWTKTSKLGAPARWLTALVRETGKDYEAFAQKPSTSDAPFDPFAAFR